MEWRSGINLFHDFGLSISAKLIQITNNIISFFLLARASFTNMKVEGNPVHIPSIIREANFWRFFDLYFAIVAPFFPYALRRWGIAPVCDYVLKLYVLDRIVSKQQNSAPAIVLCNGLIYLAAFKAEGSLRIPIPKFWDIATNIDCLTKFQQFVDVEQDFVAIK